MGVHIRWTDHVELVGHWSSILFPVYDPLTLLVDAVFACPSEFHFWCKGDPSSLPVILLIDVLFFSQNPSVLFA
jgi:hypothetical protein